MRKQNKKQSETPKAPHPSSEAEPTTADGIPPSAADATPDSTVEANATPVDTNHHVDITPHGTMLADLQKEKDRLQDRLMRLQADFENFRKRQQRERSETISRANENLILELLPVCDHLELALNAADDQQHPIAQGVRLVYEQLQRALERFTLQPINTEGAEFDPSLHEAISHLPSDVVPANTIVQQTRRGYLLGERLLRPAQVVVSRGAVMPDDRTDAPPQAPNAEPAGSRQNQDNEDQ